MVLPGVHKSLSELEKLATEQGWEVARTNGGHLQWTNPEGEVLRTSSTPSDEGIIRTIRNDLKKSGLILDKNEAKRLKRMMRKGQTVPNPVTGKAAFELHAIEWKPPNKPIAEWTDEEILQGADHMDRVEPNTQVKAVGELSSRERKAYVEMVRHSGDYGDDDRYWPETCATCGYRGEADHDVTLGLYVHLLANRDHNPTPPEGKELLVKRDMTRPPARERLDCRFCPEWFWVSQPEALAKHASVDHGKAECPYCHEWFSTIKGGLGKHMKACPKGGEQAAAQAKVLPVEADPPILEVEPPRLMAVTGDAKRSDDWNPDPCLGGCNKPVGNNPGSNYCTDCQAVMDELRREEAAANVAEAVRPKPPVTIDMDPDVPPVRGPVSPPQPRRRPLVAGGHPSSDRPAADLAPPPTGPAPGGHHPSSPEAVRPERFADLTDDELFTLLEMVLDGPVTLDRATFATVNEWMDVTRRLLAIKYGQE